MCWETNGTVRHRLLVDETPFDPNGYLFWKGVVCVPPVTISAMETGFDRIGHFAKRRA